MSGIHEIDISDEALFEVALSDLSASLAAYAIAGNRSSAGAIRWLDTLRQSLDDTRQRAQAVRAQRRSLQA